MGNKNLYFVKLQNENVYVIADSFGDAERVIYNENYIGMILSIKLIEKGI